MPTPTKPGESTDQYDKILQSLDPGVLITINNIVAESVEVVSSPELRVTHSRDGETHVTAVTRNDDEYRVYRDRSGELVYGEVDDDGVAHPEEEVISVEIIGIDN